MIYTGGTDGMGWNFGMLFTGFKVSKGSRHGAWRWDVMIPTGRDGKGAFFADDGKSLLGQGGTVG